MGVFAVMDEECIMPKATDHTFLDKLSGIHAKKHPKYSLPTAKSRIYFQTDLGYFSFKMWRRKYVVWGYYKTLFCYDVTNVMMLCGRNCNLLKAVAFLKFILPPP